MPKLAVHRNLVAVALCIVGYAAIGAFVGSGLREHFLRSGLEPAPAWGILGVLALACAWFVFEPRRSLSRQLLPWLPFAFFVAGTGAISARNADHTADVVGGSLLAAGAAVVFVLVRKLRRADSLRARNRAEPKH